MKKTRIVILSFIILMFVHISCDAKTPVMQITPSKWEMKGVMAGEHVKNTFWVKNIGTDVLSIKFRSNCDCIEILHSPDSISPGDSARLIAKYIAPTEAKEDVKAIHYSSNQKNGVGKMDVTASVIPFNVTDSTQTITMIPFTIKEQAYQSQLVPILRSFALGAKRDLGLDFLGSDSLALKISTDPSYGKDELPPIVRKWSGSLGIRYTILGEITKQGNDVVCILILNDALFPYPLTRMIKNPDVQTLPGVINSNIKSLFDNMRTEKRNATMNHLKTQWVRARQEMVGKPAPPLELRDVISEEMINVNKLKGQTVFIHFFSVDCDHCEEEIEWVKELRTKLPNVQTFGISVDVGLEDSVKTYVKSKELNYSILLPDKKNSYQLDDYYGGATPQSVIIDKDGIVREVMVGFNSGITTNFERMLTAFSQQGQNINAQSKEQESK